MLARRKGVQTQCQVRFAVLLKYLVGSQLPAAACVFWTAPELRQLLSFEHSWESVIEASGSISRHAVQTRSRTMRQQSARRLPAVLHFRGCWQLGASTMQHPRSAQRPLLEGMIGASLQCTLVTALLGTLIPARGRRPQKGVQLRQASVASLPSCLWHLPASWSKCCSIQGRSPYTPHSLLPCCRGGLWP